MKADHVRGGCPQLQWPTAGPPLEAQGPCWEERGPVRAPCWGEPGVLLSCVNLGRCFISATNH